MELNYTASINWSMCFQLRGGVISVATETLILKYGVNLNHMQNRLVTDTWDLFQTQVNH